MGRGLRVLVLAWWFLSYTSHYTGWRPIGPFTDRPACDQMRGYIGELGSRVTYCWWDGKP